MIYLNKIESYEARFGDYYYIASSDTWCRILNRKFKMKKSLSQYQFARWDSEDDKIIGITENLNYHLIEE